MTESDDDRWSDSALVALSLVVAVSEAVRVAVSVRATVLATVAESDAVRGWLEVLVAASEVETASAADRVRT